MQRSTTLPWGVARRAHLILALAAGMTITDAARVAGISRQSAYVWIKRFVWLGSGIAGWYDRQ